jgi:hypothetical protein
MKLTCHCSTNTKNTNTLITDMTPINQSPDNQTAACNLPKTAEGTARPMAGILSPSHCTGSHSKKKRINMDKNTRRFNVCKRHNDTVTPCASSKKDQSSSCFGNS